MKNRSNFPSTLPFRLIASSGLWGLAAFLTLALAGCGSGNDQPAPIPLHRLEPVLHPDLAAADPTARAQLEEQRNKVETLLANASDDDSAGLASLAGEMGELGHLYQAYGLTAPALVAYTNASGLDPGSFEWLYGAGFAHTSSGDLEAAVDDFNAAIALTHALPLERGVAGVRLAEALLELDRVEEAKNAFERAAVNVELEAAVESGLGRIALREDRAGDAISHFKRALELDPAAGALHHRLAMAYRKLGDLATAASQVAAATPGDVAFPDPIAEAIADRATTAGALSRRAGRDLVNDRPEEAVVNYRAAVEADPGNVEARRSLALALVEAGDTTAAIGELEKALELDGGNAQTHFDLANALMVEGNGVAAIQSLSRAIEIVPDYQTALFNRANALILERRWNEALSDLEHLLELDPKHGRGRYQRAMALANTGQREQAVTLLRELLVDEPANREARRGLSDILRQGSEGAPTQPQDRETWLRRAVELSQAGDYQQAEVTLESALEAFPDEPLFTAVLARLLATAPDPSVRDGARAVTLARQLYDQKPSPDNAETLCMALAEAGDFEPAIVLMEALIEQVEAHGQTGHLSRLLSVIELFRRGQPLRMQ